MSTFSTADRTHIAASPLATWTDIALAYNPISEPTEARIRTLRSHGAISPGIRLPVRGQHGVAGSHHVYSSLSLVAASLWRSGLHDEAVEAAEEASVLETEIKALLGQGLPIAAFEGSADLAWSASELRCALQDLAESVTPLRARWQELLGISETPGWWTSIAAGIARIEDRDGTVLEIAADSAALRHCRLGDPVIIIREPSPSGEVIRIVPAIDISCDPDGEASLAPLSGEVERVAVRTKEHTERPVADSPEARGVIKGLLKDKRERA